jgi:hypothetical protein
MLASFFTRPRNRQVWPIETEFILLATYHNKNPSMIEITHATESMISGTRAVTNRSGSRYIERTLEHTIAWAYNYAATEALSLNREFVSLGDKYFETDLVISKDKIECAIFFRLQTQGLTGWTRFRIAWRKLDDGYFQCLE